VPKRKAVADVRCDYFSRTGEKRVIALQHENERLTAAEYFNRLRTIFLDVRNSSQTLPPLGRQARARSTPKVDLLQGRAGVPHPHRKFPMRSER